VTTTTIREFAKRASRAADHIAAVRSRDRPLAQLNALAKLRRDLDRVVREEIASLHAAGVPVTYIGEAALISRQAVTKQLRVARQRAEAGGSTDGAR
jgi:hypothetical protein